MKRKAFILCWIVCFCLQEMLIACGGNCVECHAKLEPLINDNDHRVLQTCVSCHNNPRQQGQCGQDCFDCHSKQRFYAQDVKEHQAIKQCATCHQEKIDFTMQKKSLPFQQQPLIQMMK